MSEEWRPVVGYETLYEVSSLGRFRVSRTGSIKSCTPMYAGYLTIKLSKGGVAKTYRAHSLVLEAFVGPRPAGAQTRHLNGTRDDNRLENLTWGTAQENHADKVVHGTVASHYAGKHFTDHPNGKVSIVHAAAIEVMCKVLRQKDVAKIVGVHQSTVSNVLRSLKRHRPQPIAIAGWDD